MIDESQTCKAAGQVAQFRGHSRIFPKVLPNVRRGTEFST
jgi:hypothetical protein